MLVRHRNAKQYPEAESVPGVLIFRVDAPIYFANVEFVKDKLRKYELYHIGESFSWLEDEGHRAAPGPQSPTGSVSDS